MTVPSMSGRTPMACNLGLPKIDLTAASDDMEQRAGVCPDSRTHSRCLECSTSKLCLGLRACLGCWVSKEEHTCISQSQGEAVNDASVVSAWRTECLTCVLQKHPARQLAAMHLAPRPSPLLTPPPGISCVTVSYLNPQDSGWSIEKSTLLRTWSFLFASPSKPVV